MEGEELVDRVALDCSPPDLFSILTSTDDVATDARKAMKEAMQHVGGTADIKNPAVQAAIIRRWAADLGPFARTVFNPRVGYGTVKGALRDLGGGV
jgi:hypothetical protein